MGERVNGIHEVRGSIPLASIARLGNGARGTGHGVRKPTHSGSRYTVDVVEVRFLRRAGIAQLVEHNLAKVGVAGSSPVSRSPVGRLAKRRGVEQSGSSPGS